MECLLRAMADPRLAENASKVVTLLRTAEDFQFNANFTRVWTPECANECYFECYHVPLVQVNNTVVMSLNYIIFFAVLVYFLWNFKGILRWLIMKAEPGHFREENFEKIWKFMFTWSLNILIIVVVASIWYIYHH